MIRTFHPKDLEAVAGIWLSANIQAHAFIPAAYWRENLEGVKEQLLRAELYVYEAPDTGEILGFIGLDGKYIAGLFVREEARSKGLGSGLLNHAKALKDQLSLSVYQANTRAVRFYRREGFSVLREGLDGNTGAKEFLMTWER